MAANGNNNANDTARIAASVRLIAFLIIVPFCMIAESASKWQNSTTLIQCIIPFARFFVNRISLGKQGEKCPGRRRKKGLTEGAYFRYNGG